MESETIKILIDRKRNNMKKLIYISISTIIVIALFFVYQQNNLKRLETSYKSMSIEIMAIPKDTSIDGKMISDNIMSAMQLKEWEKINNFDYDLIPNRIIINIDDEYVFWIDEWTDNYEICKIAKRYGGKDWITGIYKIPSGTVEQIELILNSNDLEWRNLN